MSTEAGVQADVTDDEDDEEELLRRARAHHRRRVAELHKLLNKFGLQPDFNARLCNGETDLSAPPPPFAPAYDTVAIETFSLVRGSARRETTLAMREIVLPVSVLDEKCCIYWRNYSYNISHLVDVKAEGLITVRGSVLPFFSLLSVIVSHPRSCQRTKARNVESQSSEMCSRQCVQ